MKNWIPFLLISLLFVSCTPALSKQGASGTTPPVSTLQGPAATLVPAGLSPAATALSDLISTPASMLSAEKVPAFDHILVIVFENRSFKQVIGDAEAPELNQLARQYVLLTNYHAVTHPSLPNYLALLGGDTFGVESNCSDCFINTTSLPDLIEASGRTWKTYQEGLPSPCFLGNQGDYAQKHNPAVYFDSIRTDAARCARSVVSLDQLQADLAANQLPNFAFITPNLCNSSHDCRISSSDAWLKKLVDQLQASPALGEKNLIAITFDEGSADNTACCGLKKPAGGQVVTILISPQAKPGFQDGTPYSHYSLLKTILLSWGLPELGHSQDKLTSPITAPWK